MLVQLACVNRRRNNDCVVFWTDSFFCAATLTKQVCCNSHQAGVLHLSSLHASLTTSILGYSSSLGSDYTLSSGRGLFTVLLSLQCSRVDVWVAANDEVCFAVRVCYWRWICSYCEYSGLQRQLYHCPPLGC